MVKDDCLKGFLSIDKIYVYIRGIEGRSIFNMKIYFTRHGETLWNLEHRFQGWKDSELTENGVKRAELLGKKFNDIKIDKIFTSPIKRAKRTAYLIKGDKDIEVEEDVAFGPENLGVDPKEIRERVDDSLKAVGMYEYRKHAPHLLSGGQKQRIAIAGILAMRPKCIVLDEPTAMLDPSGRNEVMKTIKEVNKKFGITIILITHYMDEAAQADRIIVMDKGEKVMEGVPREIFSQVEKIKSIGLDVPQVTELAYELQKEGVDISTEILNIDEMVNALCQLK